jgi:hypothetical protein
MPAAYNRYTQAKLKTNHLHLARIVSRAHSSLLLILVISWACQPVTSLVPANTPAPFNIAERELRRQQQKWQQAGITHYRFRLFRGCICEGNEDVLIEVEHGQIISLEYQSGRPMLSWDRTEFENWGTMERLFSTLDDELNSDSLKVTVMYDSTYGFPVEVASERSSGADDELNLTISDFEVLP